jgi:hypothetical protein
MAKRGINTPSEKKLLNGGSIPTFIPRKIKGAKVRGLTGKPITVETPSTTYSNSDTLEQEFTDLKIQFNNVASRLDKSGETMRLCQNLPPVIQERYVRQKRSDESCWGFYKRMVAIAMSSPPIDINGGVTTAEALAGSGNDVTSNPFGLDDQDILGAFGDNNETNPNRGISEPVRDNYNENPGKQTLLYMLYLAILKLLVSMVFGVMKYPMQMYKKLSDDNTNAGSVTAGEVAGKTPQGGGIGYTILKFARGLATSIMFTKAVNLAVDWAQKQINNGPKLSRDVERFDALIITGFIKETAYQSDEDYWPEAVQLYPHYDSLNKQYNASMNIFDYYKQSGLHQSDVLKQTVSTTSKTVTQIPEDMIGILTLQKDYYGSSLARMDKLLGGHFTDNLFCCLFRFLGANDDKFLRTCQAILRFAMNRQALAFESLDSSLGNLWQTIQKIILSQILSVISNLFDEINRNVKGKLNLSLSQNANDLAYCLSWNVFVNNMLKYIRDIEISILDLAIDLNNSLKLQDKYQIIYIEGLEKNQTAKRLLKLIDIIIRARQNGELCRNTSVPTDTELTALYNRVDDLIDTPVETIPTTDTTGTTTVNVTTLSQNNFNDCLKKVPQEDVEKVMAWINNLKGQS